MSNDINDQYPLGFEGMDAMPTPCPDITPVVIGCRPVKGTLKTLDLYEEAIELQEKKREIEGKDAEVARVNKIMTPGMVSKMQDYARACIKKNPKATPARIGRMVAKKFKIKLTHDNKRPTGRR